MGSLETVITKKRSKVGGGSKKDRQHYTHQTKYLKQMSRTAKNKSVAWIRHLAKYPEDLIAIENIKRCRKEF
jgi:hypothetical protein